MFSFPITACVLSWCLHFNGFKTGNKTVGGQIQISLQPLNVRQNLTISLSHLLRSGLQLAYDSHQFPPSYCLFLQTVCKHLQRPSYCAKLGYHQNIMMVAASLTIQSIELLPLFTGEYMRASQPSNHEYENISPFLLLYVTPNCCPLLSWQTLRFQLKYLYWISENIYWTQKYFKRTFQCLLG